MPQHQMDDQSFIKPTITNDKLIIPYLVQKLYVVKIVYWCFDIQSYVFM